MNSFKRLRLFSGPMLRKRAALSRMRGGGWPRVAKGGQGEVPWQSGRPVAVEMVCACSLAERSAAALEQPRAHGRAAERLRRRTALSRMRGGGWPRVAKGGQGDVVAKGGQGERSERPRTIGGCILAQMSRPRYAIMI